MNVKNLKSAMALFLALANICFVVLIALNVRSKYYYDADTIENAYNAISSDGISVANGILERRQRSFSVYMGSHGISSCDDILALYGTLSDHFNVGDDVSVVSETGRFTFFRDGSFTYLNRSGVKLPDEDADFSDVTAQRKVRHMLEEAIESFLKLDELKKCDSNKKSNIDVDIYLEKILYDPETKAYVVEVHQTFDDDRVSSDGVRFVAYDDIIVSANGTFSFVYPVEKMPADCIDTLNIMFSEKNYFGGKAQTGLVLSEITYFYSVYDSADGNRYFIPMCRVLYNKTDVFSVYNLVTGKRE